MGQSKIDAFVRVYAPNELRLGLAIATVSRLKLQPELRITVVQCQKSLSYRWHLKTVNVPDAPFGMASFQVMETLAETPIYFGTDDDCLIYGKNFVTHGLSLMEQNPDFGYIAASPVNEPGLKIDYVPEIVEMHAVGGPGFVRKGIAAEFPDMENQAIAGELDRQMKVKGYKQGYARDLKYLHMGSKFSVSSPAHWVGA